jgi:hypothetical protein
MLKAYVDGVQVYMAGDAPAVSLSLNELANPSKVRGGRSTTIKIINTKEARRVFGGEGTSEALRKDRPEIVVYDAHGVECLRAKVIPLKMDREHIECTAISGNATWFDFAQNTKLRELDLGVTDPVDSDLIVDGWYNDRDVYFPLMDFGEFTQPSSFDVLPSMLRPGIRVHRILRAAFAKAGFRIRARGGFQTPWRRLVAIDPQANPSIEPPIPVPLMLLGGGGPSPTGPYFVPSTTGVGTVRVEALRNGFDPFDAAYDGIQLKVIVYDFSSREILAELQLPAYYLGDGDEAQEVADHTFTGVEFVAGHRVAVAVVNMSHDEGMPTLLNTSGATEFTYTLGGQTLVLNNSTGPSFTYDFTDGSAQGPFAIGSRLNIAAVCPDMTVAELLLSVVCTRCIQIATDALGNIDLWPDQEYWKVPNGAEPIRDWTARMDHTKDPVKAMAAIPKKVEFRWAQEETCRLLRRADRTMGGPGFANADREFPAGYTAPQTISVPFAPTAMARAAGLHIPATRKVGSNEPSYEWKPRLLMRGGNVPGTWTFNGAAWHEYPRVFFGDENPRPVLAFGNGKTMQMDNDGTMDTLWKRRLQIMENADILEAYVSIHDHELHEFDHGLPTLLDAGYGPRFYWVQEIMDHRIGANIPTKCRFVEIPTQTMDRADNPALVYPEQPLFCTGAGYISFYNSETTTNGYIEIISPTGFWAMREPDDTITVYDSAADVFSGTLSVGAYCLWTCDEAGDHVIPEAPLDFVEIESNTAGGNTITEINMAGVDCVIIDLGANALATLPNVAHMGSLMSFAANENPLTAEALNAHFVQNNSIGNSGGSIVFDESQMALLNPTGEAAWDALDARGYTLPPKP